jgi:hypothetical protein
MTRNGSRACWRAVEVSVAELSFGHIENGSVAGMSFLFLVDKIYLVARPNSALLEGIHD